MVWWTFTDASGAKRDGGCARSFFSCEFIELLNKCKFEIYA